MYVMPNRSFFAGRMLETYYITFTVAGELAGGRSFDRETINLH